MTTETCRIYTSCPICNHLCEHILEVGSPNVETFDRTNQGHFHTINYHLFGGDLKNVDELLAALSGPLDWDFKKWKDEEAPILILRCTDKYCNKIVGVMVVRME